MSMRAPPNIQRVRDQSTMRGKPTIDLNIRMSTFSVRAFSEVLCICLLMPVYEKQGRCIRPSIADHIACYRGFLSFFECFRLAITPPHGDAAVCISKISSACHSAEKSNLLVQTEASIRVLSSGSRQIQSTSTMPVSILSFINSAAGSRMCASSNGASMTKFPLSVTSGPAFA